MHNLNFRCPHCQNQVEVSLESEAMVIVMSCGHCKTPLMYYYGEAFEVDQIEMGNLQNKQLKAVQGFLKVRGIPEKGGSTAALVNHSEPGSHGMGSPVREDVIGKDDILDLMIDLETTSDVDDFLRKLG